MINTFSPIKILAIVRNAKTITSVKHKLICPTTAKRSLSSFDSFIIFCIEVLIEVSYTFSKLSLNVLLKAMVTLFLANKNMLVIITFIIVTNEFALLIFLSVYFPINDTVIICKNNDIITIEEKREKSFTAINKYKGTNNLSII